MDEGKRQGILEAATQAFARLGFRKTSIADIARRAGVAKGTIYLCAKSKEELFYQVLLKDMHAFIGEVAKAIDPRVAADELLRDVAKRAMQFVSVRPLISDLIVGLHHGELPGWEDRFNEIRALGRANLAEILRLGIRQGHFRDDLDVEQVAEILQDMNHALYIFHHRSKTLSEGELMARLEVALDVALRGLAAH